MSGTVTSGRKVFKDTASTPDTYNIGGDATVVTISGNMTAGDVINIEGLASDYTASASGRTITLKSATQTIKFQLAGTNGAASVNFLDGSLAATYGGTKVGAKLGDQKLTKKAVDVNDDKLGATDSSAVDFTGSSSSGGGSTGGVSTFILTGGSDIFTGTSGNDTFNSNMLNEGGVANITTLNNGDSIDGGVGTDTLYATYDDPATPLGITGVENLVLTDFDGNTLDLVNVTGVTSLTISGSGGAVDINNINAIPNTVTIQNQAQNVDLDIAAAAVSGSSDAMTIKVSSVTSGTLTLDTGIEIVTLNSVGNAANVLTALAATGVTTINIAGTQAIDLGTTLGTLVTKVDGSAASGAITVLQTGTQVSSIVGGSGNDVIDVSGGFVDGTTPGTRDTINGGTGTDTLVLSAAEAAAVTAAAEFSTVTGIETLRVDTDANGSNISMAVLGVTTIEFAGAVGAHTLTCVSGGEAQFDAADNATDARTYSIAGIGTNDNFTFDINGVDIGDGTQTLSGIETATFAVSGTSVLDGAITMTASAATEKMVITGTSGTFLTGSITADIVDASGYAGAFTTGTLQAATQYTGASGVDVLTDSASADILSLGAGADTLTAADGDDIITLGDGADVVDYGDIETNGAAAYGVTTGDIYTDFTQGASGDIFDFDQIVAAGGYIEVASAITELTAGTGYEVIVLAHAAFTGVGTAEDAVAGQSTSATDGIIVFFDSTLGYARMFFDADIGADGALADTACIGNLTNITTLAGVADFVAANFDIVT